MCSRGIVEQNKLSIFIVCAWWTRVALIVSIMFTYNKMEGTAFMFHVSLHCMYNVYIQKCGVLSLHCLYNVYIQQDA